MGAVAAIAAQAAGHAQSQMTGIYGSVMKGLADANTVKFNLKVSYANERRMMEQLTQEENRLRASNTVAVAKSGVEMQGSAVEVMAANAAEIARKRKLTMQAFDVQNDLLRVQRSMAQQEMALGITSQAFSTGPMESFSYLDKGSGGQVGGGSSGLQTFGGGNGNGLAANQIFGGSAGSGSSSAAQGAAMGNIA